MPRYPHLAVFAFILASLPPSSASAADLPATNRADFLPDSVALARINDRTLTVGEYVERWFNLWPEDRPTPDSAGRAQFLQSLVNKEIMALVAKRDGRPLPFEQRNELRHHTNQMLAYVFKVRAVDDSAQLSPEDLARAEAVLKRDHRFQRLVFEDLAMAAEARRQILNKKITWDQARTRFVTTPENRDEKEWVPARGLDYHDAAVLASLEPGEISEPVVDQSGASFIRLVERRPTTGKPGVLVRMVTSYMSDLRAARRVEVLMAEMRARAGLRVDSAEVRWAAALFQKSRRPYLAPEDTGRVLARYRDGQLTMGTFVHDYLSRTPLLRPEVSTPDLMRRAVDDIVLEPFKVELALQRGIDKDPFTLQLVEQRREAMLVERLYQDSIASQVQTKPAERRKYYDRNQVQYLSYATAHYAMIYGPSLEEAQKVAERLKSGERPEDILMEATRAGIKRGAVGEMRENDHDPYRDLLFQDLKPGDLRVVGPNERGSYFVIKLLSFDPGRQLSFEEAESYVDEAVRAIAADKRLQAFLARHQRTMMVEAHPELVTRVRLVDPTL